MDDVGEVKMPQLSVKPGTITWNEEPKNYIDKIARYIAEQLISARVILREATSDEETAAMGRLFRIYAVVVLVKGVDTTWKDVHDAWAAWRAESWSDHPSLVPFDKLPQDIQALDAPYCEAIRSAAFAIKDGRL